MSTKPGASWTFPTDRVSGVREIAMKSGLLGVTDADILALFLSRAMPQGAGTMAEVLMSRFGSLDAVLAAPLASLIAVIGEPGLDLKLLHEATRRLLEAPIRQRCVIGSWTSLLTYVRHDMSHRSREVFRVLFLDKKNRLIVDEIMGEGTVDHAPAYPREIARRALELSASALILVHNHPSGDPTPSETDIRLTKTILEGCKPLGINVLDHLVVGYEGVASFKALGLF